MNIQIRGYNRAENEMFFPESIDVSRFSGFLFINYTDLMLWTGLKTGDGTRIFDGDILEFTAHEGYTLQSCKMVVLYDNDSACWSYRVGYIQKSFTCHDKLQTDVLDHCKVIGNTHQNPELLEY